MSPHAGRFSRLGVSRIDVVVVVGTLLVLGTIFMVMFPHMGKHGWPSRRATCAANLKGIGTAFYTYANENDDQWPNCGPPFELIDKGKVSVRYAPGIIGRDRDIDDQTLLARTPEGELKMSVTRNVWTLVRFKIVSQMAFICPKSSDVPNRDSNPQLFWDFRSWSELSYGYQVPFGKYGRPTSECNLRMPLAADKGPFGAALEAGKPHPGAPTGQSGDSPDKWRPWNSPNHAGEGQNVLFGDAHAEWWSKPMCGLKDDNIYTRWSDPGGDFKEDGDQSLIRAHGLPPAGTETPMSETDTLIYP